MVTVLEPESYIRVEVALVPRIGVKLRVPWGAADISLGIVIASCPEEGTGLSVVNWNEKGVAALKR
jgi:hypothetical protein